VLSMSQGPGAVEKRIAELFVATKDRALSIADIADHAFALAGRPATREQPGNIGMRPAALHWRNRLAR
jgi:hypothetical protein